MVPEWPSNARPQARRGRGSPPPLPRLLGQVLLLLPLPASEQRASQPRTGLAYLPAVYLPNDLANLEDRRAIQRALTEVGQ